MQSVRHACDELSVKRMRWLTRLLRGRLPAGFWGGDIESGEREVYLTFDDGPDPASTPWLLELLASHGVVATFFLIGSQATRNEDLVQEICRAGHSIGNHSWNHWPLPVLPVSRLETEIDRTNRLLAEITGVSPSLFRAPYGILDARAAACLRERDMQAVYWGAVPEDWQAPGAEAVVRRVMRHLDEESVIVLHEQSLLARQTVAAAKEIICKASEMGLKFARVPAASGA